MVKSIAHQLAQQEFDDSVEKFLGYRDSHPILCYACAAQFAMLSKKVALTLKGAFLACTMKNVKVINSGYVMKSMEYGKV